MEKNPSWRRVGWVMRSNGKTTYQGERAERRVCQGVMQCSLCHHVVRPKQQKDAKGNQLVKHCPNPYCDQVGLISIACDAYTLLYTKGNTIYWHHFGVHKHARPPGGALSGAQERAVDLQVAMRPDATPHQLRTGTTVPGSVPLANIAPVLANPRRSRSEVDKSNIRNGHQSLAKIGSFSLFNAVPKFEEKMGVSGIIAGSSLFQPGYLSIQTPWMKQVLGEAVHDWVAPRPGAGETRHGFVTDGDHSYFTTGNLLVTVAFNLTLYAWVPVLYTWVSKLDTQHHRAHFAILNRCIVEAAGSQFERKMLSGVRHSLTYWTILVDRASLC